MLFRSILPIPHYTPIAHDACDVEPRRRSAGVVGETGVAAVGAAEVAGVVDVAPGYLHPVPAVAAGYGVAGGGDAALDVEGEGIGGDGRDGAADEDGEEDGEFGEFMGGVDAVGRWRDGWELDLFVLFSDFGEGD